MNNISSIDLEESVNYADRLDELHETLENWQNQFNIKLNHHYTSPPCYYTSPPCNVVPRSEDKNGDVLIKPVLIIQSNEGFMFEIDLHHQTFSYKIPVSMNKESITNFQTNDILELQNKCQLYSILIYKCLNILSP